MLGPLDCIQCLLKARVCKSLLVSSHWATNNGMSVCRSPLENVAYEFVPASPAVPSIFCSSESDSL